MRIRHLTGPRAVALAALLTSTGALAAVETMSVIIGGNNRGHVIADTGPGNGRGGPVSIDYDYKNNGRGPTIKEVITTDANGMPVNWTVTGSTTFGSKVNESFSFAGGTARWVDPTGPGTARAGKPLLYVAQGASPWALGLYARMALANGGSIDTWPAGRLTVTKGDVVTLNGAGGPLRTTAYTLSGLDTQPTTILLDDAQAMVAMLDTNASFVRKGYEGEDKRLQALAAQMSTDRYVALEKRLARRWSAPVRIRNVRLFDSEKGTMTAPVSVTVYRDIITGIGPVDDPATPGEVTIDGAGGTLVPGMFEMHGHLGQDDALLNLVAGVTSLRDMGNDNDVLDTLTGRIEGGVVSGPNIYKAGFIEGKSPYNSNNGIVIDTEAKAVDAVRWYAVRGFPAIKIYNSINPAWVPAMVREAKARGMHVMGHVPAFSTADQMIAAGYDEVTHINQFMLGWVIKPGEDTRTLFRLTALKRLPGLDLNSAAVQATINAMVAKKLAIDPTLGIHENLTQNRDGQVPPGAADYLANMPIGYQRNAKKAWIDTSAPGDDAAYRGAFEKILATVKMLHDRGVFIVPGTDTGGALTYHRELELYQRAGFTAAEILKRATFDSAQFLGMGATHGSIAKGKKADFFLIQGDPTRDLKAIKAIRMVMKGGATYFPSEVYPAFGIKPFATAPVVVEAAATKPPVAAQAHRHDDPLEHMGY